jgi:PAS domain S-box-containing protein
MTVRTQRQLQAEVETLRARLGELEQVQADRDQQQQALREIEDRFQVLVENASDGLSIVGADATILYESPPIARLLGIQPGEHLGMSIFELVHQDDVSGVKSGLESMLRDPSHTSTMVVRVRHSDGTWRWIECTGRNLLDDERVRGLVVNYHDITKQKQAEEALQASEANYRNVVERSADGIAIIQDGVVKYANPRAMGMVNRSPEQAIGAAITDCISSDRIPSLVDRYSRRVAGEHVSPEYETTLITEDGRRVDVELHGGAITYQGEPADLIMIRDVTKRKQVREALEKSEERFRTLVERGTDGLLLLDEAGTILYGSPSLTTMLGYEEGSADGLPFMDFLHPEDLDPAVRLFEKLVTNPDALEHSELRIRHKKGSWSHVEVMGTNRLHDSAVEAVVINLRDITERKQAEGQLLESEAKYATLVDQARVGILIIQDEAIVFANRHHTELCGRTPEELIGLPFSEAWGTVTPESRKSSEEKYTRLMAGRLSPEGCELDILCKSGEMRNVELSGQLIQYGGRPAAMAVVRDITERKRADEALRQSEEKRRSLLENSPDFIIEVDQDGTILFINRTVKQYTVQETIGRRCYDFIPTEHHDAHRQAIARVLQTGKVVNIQTAADGPRGRTSWYHTRFAPVKEEGRVATVMMIASDITQSKEGEDDLRRALQEKEVLLQEVHHRVKNNLQLISSLFNLQSRYIKDQAALRAFESTRNRVVSMSILHEKLYRAEDLGRIDLEEYLTGVVAQLYRSYEVDSNIIRTRVDIPQGAIIDIDTAVPCGMIVNELVSNSLEHAFAGGGEGEILVSLSSGDDEGAYVLTVGDNGIGLPQDMDLSNTGSLGLQLVHSLTEQLGGSLEVEATEGTTFRIRFGGKRS